ncbi:MAG: hypothetical protein K2M03_04670 [Muribaculaceae bacterium]|nr:hypothetical protein [Muribaculaceae bacterium]
MLSKEEVLEIISYCDSHKINRSDRLQELGISHWNFYKSRRHHLKAEKSYPQDNMGSFIQLKSSGEYVPSSVTAMEQSINPGRNLHTQSEAMTIECQTSRGGMVRISGKMSAELLAALVKSL